MQIQPYVFFDGRCEEAIKFYQGALGAEVNMMLRFKDNPDQNVPAECGPNSAVADKVMHADVRIGGTNVLMSDGKGTGQPKFEGFALSVTVPTPADADRVFAALGNGGRVEVPLTPTFFSPRFGMVADRFGVMWMVYVAPSKPGN
jgi:PhnB protein